MLISETLLEAEAELVHSAPIGVGGTCLQAADASPDTRSGRKVPEALRQWAAGRTDFPFTAVVDHYQVVGRNGVRPHVAAMLRDLHGKSRSDPVLAEWLPMTFDDNDASYSSYVGLDYFDQVVRSADCQRVDAFVAAAAIDLALLETRALAAAPRPPQSVRTRAAVRVVSQLSRLAPDFKLNPSVAAEGVAALAEAGTNYDSFGSAATLALRSVPEDIGAAVRLTLLPTTRLHDEQMFIRCIQIFEGLYRQIATAISTAITDLLDGNAADAKDRLDRASGRLEAIPTLFRVLTTMPVDAFSIIRGFTHGRSAVQSRAFRDVEFACAPRSQRSTDHVPKAHDEQPTLEAVFLAMRHALPDAVPLEQSMRRLDRAWVAMKRGHWGITLKVIGTVPGTGGTAGASYLQSAAKVSLFPGLPEAA